MLFATCIRHALRGAQVFVVLVATAAAMHTVAANATIVSFSSNRDSNLEEASPTKVTPDSTVYVGGGGTTGENRMLVGFDVSSLGTSVASVSSITLTLRSRGPGGGYTSVAGGPLQPTVYAVLPANATWAEGASSWNNKVQSGPTAWAGSAGLSTSGTDYAATALASVTVSVATAATHVFTFSGDLTGLINGWLSPGGNAGLFLLDTNTDTSYVGFFDSTATGGNAPLLTIEYTPVPEPSAFALALCGLCALWRVRRK
jgi:hypothetical protein